MKIRPFSKPSLRALALCLLAASACVAHAGPKDFSLAGTVDRVAKGRVTESLTLDTTEGDPGRILAQPGETFSIQLAVSNGKPSEPLRVSAEMGGVIDGKRGPFERKQLGTTPVNLTFAVGKARGRYLLEVRNGHESKFLEFWVGEEPPQGKSGPQRSFTAPTNLATE